MRKSHDGWDRTKLGDSVAGARVSRAREGKGRKGKGERKKNLSTHRTTRNLHRESADGKGLYEPCVYILYEETFLVSTTAKTAPSWQ